MISTIAQHLLPHTRSTQRSYVRIIYSQENTSFSRIRTTSLTSISISCLMTCFVPKKVHEHVCGWSIFIVGIVQLNFTCLNLAIAFVTYIFCFAIALCVDECMHAVVSKDEMKLGPYSGLFLVIGPEGVVSVEVSLFEHRMACLLSLCYSRFSLFRPSEVRSPRYTGHLVWHGMLQCRLE